MHDLCSVETNSTLTAALDLIRRGFKIFPARARDKVPALSGWQEHATTNEDQIREWFSRDGYNIGVKTGRDTGLLVVDIDPKNGGDESWEQLKADLGIADILTLTCRTGGGGRHLYFALPSGLPHRVKGPAPFMGYAGVDIRADGNLVIGPGSVHSNGGRYEFVDPAIPIATVPDVILQNLVPSPGKSVSGAAAGASIPEGSRNTNLHREATRLRLHGLAQDEVLAAINQMNQGRCRPPLPDGEVERLVKSAFDWVPTVIPTTHIEAAEHFGKLIRGYASWVPEEKTWRVFDGRVWQKDITGDVERRIKGWVKLLIEHAEALPDLDLRKSLSKVARRLGQGRDIAAVLNLTKSEPEISWSRTSFDQHADLISVSNGVLRFAASGEIEFRQHRPEDLLTKNLDVEFNAAAEAPTWHRFLTRTFDNDAEMIAFVKRAAGYSMLGEVREQIFFIGYGIGRNGKNTFIDAIAHVLGAYARTVASGSFLKGKSGIRSDIASLAGVRFAYTSEIPEGQSFDAALLKSLTGDAKISARFLFGNEFEFSPTAKHWFVTNYLPEADAEDYGLWRRLIPIPFKIVIPDEETDPLLLDKLRAEAPGILRWLVEGAQDWLKSGIVPPASIRDARQSYRQDVDVLGAFLTEECKQADELQVGASELFQHFRFWTRSQGHPDWSMRKFKENLLRKHFRQRKTNKGQVWHGLRWEPGR
ncbi:MULTISPECIES: phage/plasmid primase, P4 family [unclassified Bradyrhizobium]|uniref:phage/plasmid primase, P4 family n=1 Tax=unclassified Bradyrhizobium TaxID=2631580 RepID=UPI002478344B|nr:MULTISPECIES: phage/plasmid primase, P4 family [unclassified Bradyrhizobium]WGS18966.1 phage/plasmid primase, P4 family [Bradyrhizobium sp. ISRA463]WGS25800.1 phage/plasmid primase, P4 family [Bradyrhizobium sp. ISRA464]